MSDDKFLATTDDGKIFVDADEYKTLQSDCKAMAEALIKSNDAFISLVNGNPDTCAFDEDIDIEIAQAVELAKRYTEGKSDE